jgi:hypothetical protein
MYDGKCIIDLGFIYGTFGVYLPVSIVLPAGGVIPHQNASLRSGALDRRLRRGFQCKVVDKDWLFPAK